MTDVTAVNIASGRIADIADRLNSMAAHLAGIEPITRLLCDGGDEGDMHNALAAIGGLCDSIFDKLSDAASELEKLAKEGGAA